VTLLNHEMLREAMATALPDRLVITPLLDERQIGPSSIDLRLGTDFLFLRRTVSAGLDPRDRATGATVQAIHERLSIPLGGTLWLHPGHFLLGSTLEFIRMPAMLAAFLLGRSSWARLGLIVETAGLVQPGFAGTLTYELANTGDSPIRLYPGLRIAQLVVYQLSGPTAHADLSPERRYPAKYLAAVGPEASRLAWEDDELAKLVDLGKALQHPTTESQGASSRADG
jgi:dCTP deaminase